MLKINNNNILSRVNFKSLIKSFLILLTLTGVNAYAKNVLIADIIFDNTEWESSYQSSVFAPPPDYWPAGLDENHIWVEPSDNSSNRYNFYLRIGNDVWDPGWTKERVEQFRLIGW